MPSVIETTQPVAAESAAGAAGRRLAVVDAFIDLVLERGSAPTAGDTADRAGVSRASFFRYFATLGELRNESVTRIAERFPELLTIPDLAVGSLGERVRRFVDARVQLHEQLHALELVARLHAVTDTESAELVAAVRHVLADQARRHFDVELAEQTPARADDIVAAIAVLTSVESWQQFRQTHGRTALQTRRAWSTALTAILRAAEG